MPKSSKPVVIITGVSSGIGLETAKLFSTKGWLVVGTVRSRKFPQELATYAIDTQPAEMSKPADLARVVERTLKTYGRIDAVVANAGYGLWGRLPELSYAQVMAQLSVNLGAVAELVRLVIPVMLRANNGAIIAVSSVVGQVGLPEAPAYAASKFGLEGLLESLWHDENLDVIRFKLVEPGPINSPFWQNRQSAGARISTKNNSQNLPVPNYNVGSLKADSSTTSMAELLYEATTTTSKRLRYPGRGAVRGLFLAKRWLPEGLFGKLMRRYYRGHKS